MASFVKYKKKYKKAVGKRSRVRLSDLRLGDKFQFLKGRKVYERLKTGRFNPDGMVIYSDYDGNSYTVEAERARRIVVYLT